MSASHTHGQVPRGALFGVAALVALSLGVAGISSITGFNASPAPESTAVSSLPLHFEDLADGGIAVRDADSGQVIEVLAPGTNGFVRGALRGLVRQRRLREHGPAQPFELTRWANGQLSLTDTATGERIFLEAYGPTNRQAFARLMTAGSHTR